MVNDRFLTPEDCLGTNEGSVMRKTIGWLARQQNVMGTQDFLPFI